MYTICTGCHRQFRILAEQLAAAHGQVKCGYCGQQFDALEHLSDQPAKPEPILSTPPSETSQVDPVESVIEQARQELEQLEDKAEELSFHIPEENEPDQQHIAEDQESDSTSSTVFTFDENAEEEQQTQSQEPEPESENEEQVLSEAARETLESGKIEVSGEKQQAYEFPEELMLDEPEPRKRRLPIVLWALGSLLLIVIFAAQFAWYQRDELFQRYPQIYPYAIELCEKFNCQIQRFEDLDAIEVLNRDVRLHPGYHDTLLVNATIVNQARLPMRFPVIQLTLFDLTGEVISYRKFEPGDYLDRSINKEQGMLPEQPIHFALELTGKIDNAVSFEFDFL